jgi:hypothetical protein
MATARVLEHVLEPRETLGEDEFEVLELTLAAQAEGTTGS